MHWHTCRYCYVFAAISSQLPLFWQLTSCRHQSSRGRGLSHAHHISLIQAQYPGLLERFTDFIAGASGKRLAVFLDYDGTLTPIVKNPDKAYMSDQVRIQASTLQLPTAMAAHAT